MAAPLSALAPLHGRWSAAGVPLPALGGRRPRGTTNKTPVGRGTRWDTSEGVGATAVFRQPAVPAAKEEGGGGGMNKRRPRRGRDEGGGGGGGRFRVIGVRVPWREDVGKVW